LQKPEGFIAKAPRAQLFVYRKPLATPDMKLSGFPVGEKRWHIIGPILKFTIG